MGSKCDPPKGLLLYAPVRVAFVSPIVAIHPIVLSLWIKGYVNVFLRHRWIKVVYYAS